MFQSRLLVNRENPLKTLSIPPKSLSSTRLNQDESTLPKEKCGSKCMESAERSAAGLDAQAPKSPNPPLATSGGTVARPSGSPQGPSRTACPIINAGKSGIVEVTTFQVRGRGPARSGPQRCCPTQSNRRVLSATSPWPRHRGLRLLRATPGRQRLRVTTTADLAVARSRRPNWSHSLGNVSATFAPNATPRLSAVRPRSWSRHQPQAAAQSPARRRGTGTKTNV